MFVQKLHLTSVRVRTFSCIKLELILFISDSSGQTSSSTREDESQSQLSHLSSSATSQQTPARLKRKYCSTKRVPKTLHLSTTSPVLKELQMTREDLVRRIGSSCKCSKQCGKAFVEQQDLLNVLVAKRQKLYSLVPRGDRRKFIMDSMLVRTDANK